MMVSSGDKMELKAVIEALLMASPEPLSVSSLTEMIRRRLDELHEDLEASDATSGLAPEVLNVCEEAVDNSLQRLVDEYDASGRAFTLLEDAMGWRVHTLPGYAGFVRCLFSSERPKKLSPPAMETLAIVAYRQPVTKAALEAVRGVSCDGMLQKLLDFDLIRVAGRSDYPGRPLLYETTDFFYEHFGSRSIDDLPNAAELRAIALPDSDSDKSS